MSAGEIILILFIYLLLFGAKGVPALAQTLGKAMYQFRNATKDVQNEIMKSANEVRKQADIRMDQIDVESTPRPAPVIKSPPPVEPPKEGDPVDPADIIMNHPTDQLDLFHVERVKYYVYFLLLKPADPVFSETMALKGIVDAKLKGGTYQKKLPHVTLFQFPMMETYEKRLLECIDQLGAMKAMQMIMDGVKKFPRSNTIYISLSEQEKGHALVAELMAKMALQQILPKRKSDLKKTKELHITIAKQLPDPVIDPLMEKLTPLGPQGPVVFSELVLLRSETGTGRWEDVKTFPLGQH